MTSGNKHTTNGSFTNLQYLKRLTTSDIVGIALDLDNSKIYLLVTYVAFNIVHDNSRQISKSFTGFSFC